MAGILKASHQIINLLAKPLGFCYRDVTLVREIDLHCGEDGCFNNGQQMMGKMQRRGLQADMKNNGQVEYPTYKSAFLLTETL